MPPYPEPTLYAAPLFVLAVILEPLLLRWAKGRGRQVLGHETKDTFASLAMGVGSLVTVTAINLGVFLLATWLWKHRLLDLGTGVPGWAAAIVGWDLAYYFHHRLEHECRLFWASHVNHHSSRFFNLSTALRQPWTPFTSLLFFPPLSLFGVQPWMVMVSAGVNLIYQFWVHTEAIDRLPGWVEWVFNTPSHHRVHHGANREYLDRNYGGIFIVWDRLFRTFEPERERVVYGLTTNIISHNPFVIAFHEYLAIARDVRAARRWSHRFAFVWRGPGFRPRP
jgi:sterol desaturase/sphingolipid hydroxylase (fatty acid hydroxylase superfamily)